MSTKVHQYKCSCDCSHDGVLKAIGFTEDSRQVEPDSLSDNIHYSSVEECRTTSVLPQIQLQEMHTAI